MTPSISILVLILPCCISHYLNHNERNNIDFQTQQNHIHGNAELDDIWEFYKDTHKKVYTTEEDGFRRSIWETNVAYIQRHNLEYDLDYHTYRMGINQFTDWTIAEYKRILGFKTEYKPEKYFLGKIFRRTNITLPDKVDWRTKGYVTPVKNQGQCGSCWAFSSTGSLEGQHFAKTGRLVSLAEQNLVDCVKDNGGCNGGWMNNAFLYVKKNNGIDTEDSYPYTAENGPCVFDQSSVGASCTGYTDIEKGSEEDLKDAVATKGPISVAIDATHASFMSYQSGIYKEPDCSTTDTDHAVLVVGYGTDAGQDYWLVKNSWGTSWGMQGYIKMARNNNNMCAIASFASYPTM